MNDAQEHRHPHVVCYVNTLEERGVQVLVSLVWGNAGMVAMHTTTHTRNSYLSSLSDMWIVTG